VWQDIANVSVLGKYAVWTVRATTARIATKGGSIPQGMGSKGGRVAANVRKAGA